MTDVQGVSTRPEQAWTVVVNPAAARGRGARALAPTLGALEAAGVTPSVVRTTDLAHGAAQAAEAAQAGATVVAVGGDGLVGALAGAVAGTPGRLGVVPAGRGNDFARSLGLPLDAAAAARILPGARERLVDVGEVDGRPFVGIASVGVDAEANRLANAAPAWVGPAVYSLAGIAALARWRHTTFGVTVDDRTVSVRGFAVGVGNAPYYGGGLRLLPEARLDDAALDVCIFGEDRRLRLLREIPGRRTGVHSANPTVTFHRGATVRITTERPLVVYADGEPIGVTPATVGIRPGALRVLGPA